MSGDLIGLGEFFGNLGHDILMAAAQMPGLAEVLLRVIVLMTGFLGFLLSIGSKIGLFGVSILTAAMAIEEFMRWGGLLVSLLGKMGFAVEDLGPKFLSVQRFSAVFMSLFNVLPNVLAATTQGLSDVIGRMTIFGAAGQSAAGGLSALSTKIDMTLGSLSLWQAMLVTVAAVGIGILIDKIITIQDPMEQFTVKPIASAAPCKYEMLG